MRVACLHDTPSAYFSTAICSFNTSLRYNHLLYFYLMYNEKSYFQLHEFGNQLYPIVNRKKGRTSIDECPYCGEEHNHGDGEGRPCFAHCLKSHGFFKEIIVQGNIIPQERGYIIEEY